MVVGDVNNDGYNDIILANAGQIDTAVTESDVRPLVLLNRGNGVFYDGTASVFVNTPDVQGWVNDTLVYDFNGDDKNDILFIDHGREVGTTPYEGFFNTLYLSSTTGLLNQTTGIEQTRSFWHGAQNAADVDGDGDLDFAAAALAAEIVDIFINDGSGRFSNESTSRLPDYVTQWQTSSGQPIAPGTVAFLDANGDGFDDLITAPYANSFPDFQEATNFHILLNDGQGNFTAGDIVLDARAAGLPDYYGYQSVHVGDFDGNGLDDFIAVAEVNTGISGADPRLGSYVSYYKQTSEGIFSDVTSQSFSNNFISAVNFSIDPLNNHALNELMLGDVDGDGDIDLMHPYFRGRPEDLSTTIYVNNNGVFSPFSEDASFAAAENNLGQSFPQIDSGSSRTLLGDVNNDGVADVISLSSVFNSVESSTTNPFGLSLTIDVIASSGVTSFIGSNERETLIGASASETFTGKGGNDTLIGGAGVDTALYGAASTSASVSITDIGQLIVNAASAGLGTDTLSEIERIQFSDVTLAFDLSGNAGQVYRLYQAAFARTPDTEGLTHNISLVDSGLSLTSMSNAFIGSAEFIQRYGTGTTDTVFINALYNNVLGRDADDAGLAGWQERLSSGTWDRTGVLIGFSESSENQTLVGTAIANGIEMHNLIA